jgi:hypothetical protein
MTPGQLDPGDNHRDQDRYGPENRCSLANRASEERTDESITNEPPARELALRSQLVLEIQQFIAVAPADARGIEPQQRTAPAVTHAGWAPTRAKPTLAMI